jgi:hypothetical protein
MRTDRNLLKEYLENVTGGKFTLDWYSPGDGVYRYKILPAGSSYFSNDGVARALGLKEAEAIVRAFISGYQAALEKTS